MLGLDTSIFFDSLLRSLLLFFFSCGGVLEQGVDVGALNNNRQHSSYLPNSLLCGSALENGQEGEGALGHSGFTILACCTS